MICVVNGPITNSFVCFADHEFVPAEAGSGGENSANSNRALSPPVKDP